MPFAWSAKDPDEEYEYTHDWAPRLLVNGEDVGDALILSDDPDPLKHPTIEAVPVNGVLGDVEISAIVPVPATSKLQYWTEGGTTKTKFTATVHTAQGRTYQESFVLPVKER